MYLPDHLINHNPRKRKTTDTASPSSSQAQDDPWLIEIMGDFARLGEKEDIEKERAGLEKAKKKFDNFYQAQMKSVEHAKQQVKQVNMKVIADKLQLDADKQNLKQEKNALDAEKEKLQAEKKALATEMQKFGQDKQAFTVKTQKFEQEKNAFEAHRSQELQRLADRKREMEAEFESLKQQYLTMQKTLKDLQAEEAGVRTRKEQILKEEQQLKKQSATLDHLISTTALKKGKYMKRKEEVDAIIEEVRRLETEAAAAQQRLSFSGPAAPHTTRYGGSRSVSP